MQPQPLPGPAPCSDYAPVPRLDQRCEQVVEFATARLGFVHLCGLTFGSGPKVWSRVSSPVHACHAARINSWAARVRCHALPALPIFSQIGAEGGNDLLRLLTCQSHGALSNLPAEARSGEGRKLATVLLRRAGAGAKPAMVTAAQMQCRRRQFRLRRCRSHGLRQAGGDAARGKMGADGARGFAGTLQGPGPRRGEGGIAHGTG
jgi:hypothetical protein